MNGFLARDSTIQPSRTTLQAAKCKRMGDSAVAKSKYGSSLVRVCDTGRNVCLMVLFDST